MTRQELLEKAKAVEKGALELASILRTTHQPAGMPYEALNAIQTAADKARWAVKALERWGKGVQL